MSPLRASLSPSESSEMLWETAWRFESENWGFSPGWEEAYSVPLFLHYLASWGAREDSWESLGQQGDQSVNPKGNLPQIFIGRTGAEAPTLWPLMWRADSLEKTLMLGKIEGRRRRGWQRTKWLDGIINSTDMSLSQLRETTKHRDASCAAVHEVAKSWTQLSNWTSTTTASWGCKRNYWIYWLWIPFSRSWSYFLPRVPLPMLNFPHSAIPTRIKAMQLETTSLTTGPFQQLRLWDKIKN